MKRKIYSFNSELHRVTGVQKVLMDIHHAICEEYNAKVVGTLAYDKVNADLNIKKGEYVHLRNPFMFYNSVVILHERKFLMFFWILNHFLFQKIKLVYIHHNIFDNKAWMCPMPKHIVAISNKGIENLTNYFHVPKEHIYKIYNCVIDDVPKDFRKATYHKDRIKILYVANIGMVKRQVELVKRLKGKLDKRIEIHFIGTGTKLNELKALCEDDVNFVVDGYANDVHSRLLHSDYSMLFSSKEGLPITLIEATMSSLPIICNSVGGNTEIAVKGKNAFVTETWDDLIDILNSLPSISDQEYLRMSRNSRDIYEQKFTFEAFKQHYLNLLGNL